LRPWRREGERSVRTVTDLELGSVLLLLAGHGSRMWTEEKALAFSSSSSCWNKGELLEARKRSTVREAAGMNGRRRVADSVSGEDRAHLS
jgi:hypothetical protein